MELENSHNVTAVLERGALLNCRVRGIGNRTVSSQSLHFAWQFQRKNIWYVDVSSIRFYAKMYEKQKGTDSTGQHWVRKWISQETQEFNITGNVEIIFFLPTRSLLWTFVRYYFSASRCWQLKFLTLEPLASNEKEKPWFIIFWFLENFVSTNYLFGNNAASYWPAITKCPLQGRIQPDMPEMFDIVWQYCTIVALLCPLIWLMILNLIAVSASVWTIQ